MSLPWPAIAALALLILANGVFAMAELAIVSARKARLEQRASKGDRAALQALRLAEDPNRFLSTVQVGITLVGTLAGAIGGAAIAEPLARRLATVPHLDGWAEPIAFGLVVVTITYMNIVLGELVPKRLALAAPERLARLTAPGLRLLAVAAIPVVKLLGASTELILRVIGIRHVTEPSVTEEDITLLVRQGMQAGVLEPAEHDMVRRVFRLGDRNAGALMTPRSDIVWIDLRDPPEEIRRKVTETPHTCFPVCDATLDDVLGVVRVKDMLPLGLAQRPPDLRGLLTMPLFLYEGTRGLKVLDTFKKSGHHFAVVLDEYGSVEGVLTLTDLLEAIVGDLPSPDEASVPRAVRRADGSWLVDAMLSADEFRDLVAHRDLPNGDYHTVAGFIISRLGHIPSIAETFTWDGLRFEVVDMAANRISRVRVAPVEPEAR